MIEHDNPSKPPYKVGDLLLDRWGDLVLVLDVQWCPYLGTNVNPAWKCVVFDLSGSYKDWHWSYNLALTEKLNGSR